MERMNHAKSPVKYSPPVNAEVSTEKLEALRREAVNHVMTTWETAFNANIPTELVVQHLQIAESLHAVAFRELTLRAPQLDYQGLFDACRNAFLYMEAANGTTGLDHARINAAKHELAMALEKHDAQVENMKNGLPPKF